MLRKQNNIARKILPVCFNFRFVWPLMQDCLCQHVAVSETSRANFYILIPCYWAEVKLFYVYDFIVFWDMFVECFLLWKEAFPFVDINFWVYSFSIWCCVLLERSSSCSETGSLVLSCNSAGVFSNALVLWCLCVLWSYHPAFPLLSRVAVVVFSWCSGGVLVM